MDSRALPWFKLLPLLLLISCGPQSAISQQQEEMTCQYSLFVWGMSGQDSNGTALAFMPQELSLAMGQFCAEFDDNGTLNGKGQRCFIVTDSASLVPTLSVQVYGCCSGQIASDLLSAYSDKGLQGCRTVGAGKDPIKLDVNIVPPDEDPAPPPQPPGPPSPSPLPPPPNTPPPPNQASNTSSTDQSGDRGTVTVGVLDADDQVKVYDATPMDGLKDWRVWAILAAIAAVMLCCCGAVMFCLCRKHRKKERDEQRQSERRQIEKALHSKVLSGTNRAGSTKSHEDPLLPGKDYTEVSTPAMSIDLEAQAPGTGSRPPSEDRRLVAVAADDGGSDRFSELDFSDDDDSDDAEALPRFQQPKQPFGTDPSKELTEVVEDRAGTARPEPIRDLVEAFDLTEAGLPDNTTVQSSQNRV
eukprot:CAMPEP_0117660900 /NCGR_PEP_ID=MMETSP0804-20121206/7232_1 /TAXON_ID=1074897 /ORGANISM="Tetraselmis astigmatica, Strain CCMP880" /LENGTH=413 /DNA_ID=CAMNT_0005467695 /DNA_START=297 /DNA_END=1538 /DNA_ORIENTATION=-